MRKKIAMRKGGKVAKYADGGTVRGSAITNNPVGRNRGRTVPIGATALEEGGREMAPYEVVVEAERPLPTPPIPPRRSRPARSRAMSADDLNDREMTRILNERSLEAARAGRNMYKKGGRVMAKCK